MVFWVIGKPNHGGPQLSFELPALPPRVGPFPSRGEAQQAIEQLKQRYGSTTALTYTVVCDFA